jgi:hypothetical protein
MKKLDKDIKTEILKVTADELQSTTEDIFRFTSDDATSQYVQKMTSLYGNGFATQIILADRQQLKFDYDLSRKGIVAEDVYSLGFHKYGNVLELQGDSPPTTVEYNVLPTDESVNPSPGLTFEFWFKLEEHPKYGYDKDLDQVLFSSIDYTTHKGLKVYFYKDTKGLVIDFFLNYDHISGGLSMSDVLHRVIVSDLNITNFADLETAVDDNGDSIAVVRQITNATELNLDFFVNRWYYFALVIGDFNFPNDTENYDDLFPAALSMYGSQIGEASDEYSIVNAKIIIEPYYSDTPEFLAALEDNFFIKDNYSAESNWTSDGCIGIEDWLTKLQLSGTIVAPEERLSRLYKLTSSYFKWYIPYPNRTWTKDGLRQVTFNFPDPIIEDDRVTNFRFGDSTNCMKFNLANVRLFQAAIEDEMRIIWKNTVNAIKNIDTNRKAITTQQTVITPNTEDIITDAYGATTLAIPDIPVGYHTHDLQVDRYGSGTTLASYFTTNGEEHAHPIVSFAVEAVQIDIGDDTLYNHYHVVSKVTQSVEVSHHPYLPYMILNFPFKVADIEGTVVKNHSLYNLSGVLYSYKESATPILMNKGPVFASLIDVGNQIVYG